MSGKHRTFITQVHNYEQVYSLEVASSYVLSKDKFMLECYRI